LACTHIASRLYLYAVWDLCRKRKFHGAGIPKVSNALRAPNSLTTGRPTLFLVFFGKYSPLHLEFHSIDSPVSISLLSFHQNVAKETYITWIIAWELNYLALRVPWTLSNPLALSQSPPKRASLRRPILCSWQGSSCVSPSWQMWQKKKRAASYLTTFFLDFCIEDPDGTSESQNLWFINPQNPGTQNIQKIWGNQQYCPVTLHHVCRDSCHNLCLQF